VRHGELHRSRHRHLHDNVEQRSSKRRICGCVVEQQFGRHGAGFCNSSVGCNERQFLCGRLVCNFGSVSDAYGQFRSCDTRLRDSTERLLINLGH
jgi:hypothetical protein